MGCLLYASCKQASAGKGAKLIIPLNAKITLVKLVDTLGTLSVAVPTRYDTSFSWMELADCGLPCDKQEYRFERRDSLERFTISHSEYYPFHDGDTSRNMQNHLQLRADLTMDVTNPPIVFDTIEKINDRYYSIFEMEWSGTPRPKRVLAVTTIKGNSIWFQYDLLMQKEDPESRSFIKNSLELIRTIRIAKGI